MKELKFRAWDKKFKVMITDDTTDEELYELWKKDDYTDFLYKEDEWYPVREISILFYFNNLFKNERLELMQSTGLFDKNGVEIFEGDVIIDHLLNDKNGEYFAVVKCDNYFYLKMIRHGIICNNIIDPMMFNQHTHLNGVEVVGNIYKDSEFLEVE